MKYGINTLLWTAAFNDSHLDLLPRIKAWGYDGVEIAAFNFQGYPSAKVRRAAEQNGLEVTTCTALTGRMSLANEQSPATLTFMKDAIHWSADIGARCLAGPFCSAVGYLPGRRRTDDEWKRVIEGLRALGPVLEETGIQLAVEPLNRFETYLLNTAEDGRALCDAVNHPQVGILFDTFHANIEEKNIPAALAAIGPHLKHVHTCENDRGTPGTGHVVWPELFESLGRRHYDGWLVIESFGAAIPEIAAAACVWRDLAASPESLAEEGLRFLKQSS